MRKLTSGNSVETLIADQQFKITKVDDDIKNTFTSILIVLLSKHKTRNYEF